MKPLVFRGYLQGSLLSCTRLLPLLFSPSTSVLSFDMPLSQKSADNPLRLPFLNSSNSLLCRPLNLDRHPPHHDLTFLHVGMSTVTVNDEYDPHYSGDAGPSSSAPSNAPASIPSAPVTAAEPPAQQISMRCLIVTQDASVIIGRGGAHVNEIRVSLPSDQAFFWAGIPPTGPCRE